MSGGLRVILATRPVRPRPGNCLVLDLTNHTLSRGFTIRQFGPVTFAILTGRVLSAVEIVERVYLDDPSGGPDTAEEMFHTLITRLRRDLAPFRMAIANRFAPRRNHGFYHIVEHCDAMRLAV